MKIPIRNGSIHSVTTLRIPDPAPLLRIELAICREFNITRDELASHDGQHKSPGRTSHPRFLALELIRQKLGFGAHKSSRYFGMHHSSANWARWRVKELTETDPVFRAKREAVERAL